MKLFITTIIVLLAFIISGCTRPYYSPYHGYNRGSLRVNQPPIYNQRVRTPSTSRRSYTARINVDGDVSYVDRKYFKQTLSEALYRNGIISDYNSPNTIDIRIITTIEDSKTSGGSSYQNCSAFKLDRKAQGAVIYTVKGKGYYTNSINYKFKIKSASCVSYDDAELKARKMLYRRLGEVTASKIIKLKPKLRRNGASYKR